MKFNILGPPELSGIGPQDMKLSPQLWGVLASVLMAEGTPVPVDSLVDRLWGWDPPPMAAATVRTYVSRINGLLARHGMRIRPRAGGYQLTVDPQDVDLHRFRSLRRQAESVAASGDRGHAVALLRQAEGLWRGPLLMGLPGEWASARRQVLDEERREAVKLRIGMELDLGRQGGILGELRELSERHPLDEEIARALMVSLYRLGRQADALQAGRAISERFAEAGMEPSPQLRDVHLRILRGDAGLGVTPAYRSPGSAGQPNTLPPEAGDFVGRTQEAGLLTAGCHGNAPLLEVIEGMAGVGKTALAIHVAHRMTSRYPDAQLFLPFPGDGPGSAAEALDRLLRQLGVPADRVPGQTSEKAKLWHAEIAHRRVVIVLDDVPGPEQLSLIAPAEGDSLTVVTSRQHASWPGQRALRLEPLGAEDSVALLVRAAGPAAGRYAEKAATAASLCGGLPLALRVAAGRLRQGDLADLDNLIGELADIHAGHADGTEVGRRIFSAFELTYRQLTAEDQRIFRLLGASPCTDFGLETAAALTGRTRASAANAIRTLSGCYLLERTSGGRCQFHDLIRSYAAARCAQEEHASEVRRANIRLIQHYSSTLKAATTVNHEPSRQDASRNVNSDDRSAAQFPGPGSAHAWLEAEWRNILLTARHAARHEQHRQCADLTHSLASFLQTGGYWSDAIAAHELALQACRLLGDPARAARSALDLSGACRRTGDYGKARRHAGEALTACTSLGDLRGQAAALDQLGVIYQNSGSTRDALAHHQEAADLFRSAGDYSGMGRAVMHAAAAFGLLGRPGEASSNLRQALSLFQQGGDRRGEAMCLNNLGAVLEDQGLHRDAVAHYERSAVIFRGIGGRQNLTLLDHNLGRVQQYKGNHDEAITIYRKALAAYYAIGDLRHQAIALSDIGTAYESKECHNEALVHHQKSAGLAEAIDDKHQLAAALCGMGDAYRGSGSYGAAAENYRKAHRLAAEIEAPYLSGKALYGVAETLLITEGRGVAKIYWREAHDIFTQLGVREAGLVELRLYGPGATAS